MIKVISFDIWGTLLKVEVMFNQVVEELSFLTGFPISEIEKALSEAKSRAKDLRLSGCLPAKEAVGICQGIFAELLGVDVDLVKRACSRAVLKIGEGVVIEGSVDAVRLAKEKGFRVCCLGNVQFWPSALTRVYMERFGVSQYLDKHFFSDELGYFKPDSKAFRVISEFFGVSLSEVLHVGDRELEDYQGALQAGCKALLVSPSRRLKDQLYETLTLESS